MSSQNHNLRCAFHLVKKERQALPIFHQKESKQVAAARHRKYCCEELERKSQTRLGKIIIPPPFNYTYHTKNSCIVFHSLIIVQWPHLWNMKIFDALQMKTAGCFKPRLRSEIEREPSVLFSSQ